MNKKNKNYHNFIKRASFIVENRFKRRLSLHNHHNTRLADARFEIMNERVRACVCENFLSVKEKEAFSFALYVKCEDFAQKIG